MLPEFLEYGFMHRALVAGAATALVCPAIGVFLVPRRLSLIADTLAHVALAGVALGLVVGVAPVWGALVVTLGGAVGIERLRARGALQGDAALAVFLSGGFAVAVVLISLARGFNADLFGVLFGSILTVSPTDVALILGLGGVVTATIGLFYRQLLAITLNEELARTSGVPADALNLLLTVLTALTTVVTMRMVGVLLVSAMIVIPTLTGFTLGRSFRQATIIAMASALAAVTIGLVAAYYLRLAAGGAIVLMALVGFAGARVAQRIGRPGRRWPPKLAGTALLLIALGLPGPGAAHPHVFIEYSAIVLFGARGPEGVQFAWAFDDLFGRTILQQFDTDHDGAFSRAETRVIETQHFGRLKEYRYFVAVKVGGQPMVVDGIRDFETRVSGGRVSYVFTVPITGANPVEGTLHIALDDPTFFTALVPDEKAPVRFQAPPHYRVQCSVVKDPKTGWVEGIACTYKRQQ